MANLPITVPAVTKFSNEQTRPHSEKLLGIHALLTAMDLEWNNVIAPELAGWDDTDYVDDGREAEGINRLTKNDLTLFQVQVQALLTQFNAAGVLSIIQKPNVRSLESIL